MTHARLTVALLMLGVGVACRDKQQAPAGLSPPRAETQSFSVADRTHDAFSLPMPNLTDAHRTAFFVGNSLFNQTWVAAPATVKERDGLGPLFNARSCSGCHFKDGRGAPQAADEPQRGVLLRISVPNERGGAQPHPVYGDQLQTDALPGLAPEVKVATSYKEIAGSYQDGEAYHLRVPTYELTEAAYGPLGDPLQISARVAPQTVGLGLLEAIPASALATREDVEDRDHDGISGRVSRLAPHKEGMMVGRFGWKAEQPSLRSQIAGAFLGDMGITSRLFAHENHTEAEDAARSYPSGGQPELSDAALTHVETYMRTLAVPAQRPEPTASRGERLFVRAACDRCHTPTQVTGVVEGFPELSGKTIYSYTDLLLHDMGEGLADGRQTASASASEWRTAPLWAVGLIAKVNGHAFLLHDGRARGVAEAILWHGGEGKAARDAFIAMSRSERAALLAFVESR